MNQYALTSSDARSTSSTLHYRTGNKRLDDRIARALEHALRDARSALVTEFADAA